jgi:signal transduction histidine kinase
MPIQPCYLPELLAMTKEYDAKILLSHELRTALCIILLATEALQFELFGPLTEAQHEVVAKIYENSTYLRTLLDANI